MCSLSGSKLERGDTRASTDRQKERALMTELGAAIRIIREAKGLRQSELAKRAGLSAPYLSLIESGDREASIDALRRIAQALEIPPEVLLIASQPAEGSLESRDERANLLVESVGRIKEAERKLRRHLEDPPP